MDLNLLPQSIDTKGYLYVCHLRGLNKALNFKGRWSLPIGDLPESKRGGCMESP